MSQIKSKQRVKEKGEVFTNSREINAMLDLVKNETQRIESRFLEPACGNGNFLIEILKRKLEIVTNKYKKNQTEWEKYAVIAVSSCYGVEILEDNCQECRNYLESLFTKEYSKLFKKKIRNEVIDTIKFILLKNIICGDALTMKQNNGNPIIFSEWSAINSSKIKRRDFTMANLLETESFYENKFKNQPNLFEVSREEGIELITPKVVADYPITNFDELYKMEYKENNEK